jgi:hypothetical protein
MDYQWNQYIVLGPNREVRGHYHRVESIEQCIDRNESLYLVQYILGQNKYVWFGLHTINIIRGNKFIFGDCFVWYV